MKLSSIAAVILSAAILPLGLIIGAAPVGAQDNYDVVILNGRVMDP